MTATATAPTQHHAAWTVMTDRGVRTDATRPQRRIV